LERATVCRKRLLATGYAPLPVNGKAPPFAGWQDIAATNKIIETWETKYPDAASTGILTVSVPTIDIDIMHPEAAAAIETLAREHFEERGHILVRFGKAPKRAIPLRSDEPFKKLVRKSRRPITATNSELKSWPTASKWLPSACIKKPSVRIAGTVVSLAQLRVRSCPMSARMMWRYFSMLLLSC
jgi:hypothetical protein